MRLRSKVLAALAVFALVGSALVGLAAADLFEDDNITFTAGLSGAAEVPGPGDADGVGTAVVTADKGSSEICFALSVSNITLPAILAHIHRGTADVAGPVVVNLVAPDATGNSTGCVAVDPTLFSEIIHDPAGFYVNVHTTDFPAGAVRGQLSRGSRPLTTSLSGAEEAPGPGDADGTGSALITVDQKQATICFVLTVADITLPAIAAHIHQAPAGVAGPIVVALTAPNANGLSSGCVAGVSKDVLRQMRADPTGFYVNVHTTDFPAGAVRGQLGD